MIILDRIGDSWVDKPATVGHLAVWRHEYLSQSRERWLVGDYLIFTTCTLDLLRIYYFE